MNSIICGIICFVVGFLYGKRTGRNSITQSQESGDGSTQIQIAKINNKE